MPAGERAALHHRAAELLHADGSPPGRVAVHLLAAEPAGDRWVVEILREAAARSIDRGAPEAAVEFLRRALREPPPHPQRAGVLAALGRAQLLAGDADEGSVWLRQALAEMTDPRERALTGQALGHALVPEGRYEAALEVEDAAIRDARAAGDENLAMMILAEASSSARLRRATVARGRERLAALDAGALPGTPGGRALLGELAMDALLDGRDAATARLLAERALADGTGAFSLETNALWDATYALSCADAPVPARAALEEMRGRARDRGSILAFTRASAFLSMLAHHEGRIADAEADARAALAASEGQPWYVRVMAGAALCNALVDRGRLDEAGEVVTAIGGWGDLDCNLMFNFMRLARGRLLVARGDAEQAVEDLRGLGELDDPWRGRCPAAMPWRTHAALALHRCDRVAEAQELAEEELALARGWGAPSAVGRSLVTLGTVTGTLAPLEEATEVLADSVARLEHARALAALGAHLRRANRRADARRPLTLAIDLAHRCGADALVQHAQVELRATGARPRRLRLTGVDALTPSEGRVAAMAAEGMSNREIAQALFVTMRTVEVHLSHSYAKLAIESREQLPPALEARGAAG